MKGKYKFLISSIIVLLAMLLSVICFSFIRAENIKVYAVLNYHENFSGTTPENLIFSVEKVGVNADYYSSEKFADGVYNDLDGMGYINTFKTPLYNTADEQDPTENMFIRKEYEKSSTPAYYYKNLSGNLSNTPNEQKYVVKNGEFVMLNNQLIEGEYINQDITSVYKNEGGYQPVRLSEAILISFGAYYFDENGNAETAGENAGARIDRIYVTAEKDGRSLTLPSVRNYTDNLTNSPYEDFVYIIPQLPGNEGHYEFDLSYTYNGATAGNTIHFEFNLLFKTSYTATEQAGADGTYTAEPTMFGASFTPSGQGQYTYNLGQTTNYPTLVYDYTKYKMSYTHTANGFSTEYSFTPSVTMTGARRNVSLNAQISGVGSVAYPMYKYNAGTSNFVVFVFTEMGEYTFNFSYLYEAETSGGVTFTDEGMNLTKEGQSLTIHGFELKYAKQKSVEGQLRQITLSGSQSGSDSLRADIIAPNDIERINELANLNLNTFTAKFSYNNTSDLMVGKVVSQEDANVQIQNVVEDFDTFVTNASNGSLGDVTDINFVKTNQVPLWLTSNNAFTTNSCYYYSATSTELTEAEKRAYTNQTSFNKPGYYLVFIGVNTNADEGAEYWQAFAFNYTSEVVNAEITETTTERKLGNDQFTAQSVAVSWEPNGTFECEIHTYYYFVLDKYIGGDYTREKLMSEASAVEISNGASIGGTDTVPVGHGASFVVEVVGMGRSYRVFNIDRQPITGVNLYSVMADGTNLATFYRVQTDNNGNYVQLSNSISSGLVTLNWNDKSSGAKINATYTYTPFIKDNSAEILDYTLNSSELLWISTNYKLGSTSEAFNDYVKPDILGAELGAKNILKNAGIYLFTLQDEAGNQCKYMFVIDKTEAFFRLKEDRDGSLAKFVTRTNEMFSDSTTVTVGTHKVINLFNTGADISGNQKELYNFISSFALNQNVSGYYNQTGTNASALQQLFAMLNNDCYLTVKNSSLHIYDEFNSSSTINVDRNYNSYTVQYNENDGTSTIRTIYLQGVNQTGSDRSSNSYVRVEINQDNSRLYAYYSNLDFGMADVPDEGGSSSSITRLTTGNNITNTKASADSYFGIVFNKGSGAFAVESVKYDYFTLNVSSYDDNGNYTEDGKIKFFEHNKSEYIYLNGVQNGAVEDDERVFAKINILNRQTQAGLYIVTRKYVSSENLGSDKQTIQYWFIVDRYGIIDSGVTGENIAVKLFNETYFKNFNIVNPVSGEIGFADRDDAGVLINSEQNAHEQYNIYFTTNKLPAELNIPLNKIYKLIEGQFKGSNYFAGGLNIKVLFNDTQSQLSSNNNGYVIFNNTISYDENDRNNPNKASSTGLYSIDFYAYMRQYMQESLVSRFADAANPAWICLPGDYVVVITDNVEASNGVHKLVFGFSVLNPEKNLNYAPKADIYAIPAKLEENQLSPADEDALKSAGETPSAEGVGVYSLTTNKEYVVVDLPEYAEVENYENSNRNQALYARIDPNFLQIERNGIMIYNYNYIDAQSALNPNSRVNTENGRKVYLYTELRNADGSINYSALNSPLEYTIRVRFKLSNVSESENYEKYKNCYYYFDSLGQRRTYFEASYTIIIDRIAPTENINALTANDNFALRFVGEEIFTPYVYDTSTRLNSGEGAVNYQNLYFTNQYAEYYRQNDLSKIYALRVNANTGFNTDDVVGVYYRTFSANQLNMPVSAFNNYNYLAKPEHYADFVAQSERAVPQLIEIVEVDKASNQTQYVVFYEGENGASDTLNLKFTTSQYENNEFKDDADFSIDLSEDVVNETITIFDISSAETLSSNNIDKFYHIELINRQTGTRHEINTNLATDFNTLARDIVAMINGAIASDGYGNYTLNLVGRAHQHSYNLNYFNKSEVFNEDTLLNARELVNDEKTIIDLTKAVNEIRQEDGAIRFVNYAEKIEITHNDEPAVYLCHPNENYAYYDAEGNLTTLLTDLSGTYQIVLTDIFGRLAYHEFNTERDLYSFTFVNENGNSNYYKDNSGVYYTYNQVDFMFDELYTASINYTINNGVSQAFNIYSSDNEAYNGTTILSVERPSATNGQYLLHMMPYYGEFGAVIEFEIVISKADGSGFSHTENFVIDTTANGILHLRDTRGNNREFVSGVNAEYSTVKAEQTYSGTTNLSWENVANNHFDFTFTLYEQVSEDETNTTNLNGQTSYIINTSRDSLGKYWFVVEIYAKGVSDLNNITDAERTQYYLGNKVYAFVITAELNQLYYVRTDYKAIESNSSFKFSDLEEYSGQFTAFTFPNTDSEYPLYISSSPMQVEAEPKLNAVKTEVVVTGITGAELRVYQIKTPNYNYYLATLYVYESENFVTDISINGSLLDVQNNNNFTFAENVNYTLTASKINTSGIVNKNLILADVYYGVENEEDLTPYYITTITGKLEGEKINLSFDILGNGQYTLVFKDLAGNVHKFDNGSGSLTLNILREVVVYANGMPAIDNAFYNGEVELTVHNYSDYVRGSVTLFAMLNGQNYTPQASSFRWVFADYGTYRVRVNAKVDINGQEIDISRLLVFTILNIDEARQSIDLTSLNGYQITHVSNNAGEDITEAFITLMNENLSQNGMLVTYEFLVAHRSELGITAGRQTITISYTIDAGIYYAREGIFAFTLNNEVPRIECSLAPGETSNKGFSLTFNPGIIYEQVGECVLEINGQVIYTIDASSPNSTVSHYVSQKENGSGDYYVTLRSASGGILSSYKLTLTEPLNTFAIIIIVVVSVLIITVVVVIIVLRTKMRIR